MDDVSDCDGTAGVVGAALVCDAAADSMDDPSDENADVEIIALLAAVD